ncbi:hypothetical protein KP79_PYT22981 [Mizuhopecten yessoensis]|uniref:Uncharacterized protein n=1 Tax=Mizuhopecten yessoensis TaxID=6573 RepID=A0A210PJ63_MIZYE|nr:hypothetical protein KP79_PYT22981 [Mizuhopecten yessoensis]
MDRCGTPQAINNSSSGILSTSFLDSHLISPHISTPFYENNVPDFSLRTRRTPVVDVLKNSFVNITDTPISHVKFQEKDDKVSSDCTSTMAKIVCETFSGYPHENAQRFISQFNSYSMFLNLQNDSRKVAAFHLHLKGPFLYSVVV